MLTAGIMFFLLLVSYKFSLLHETAQLSFLSAPTIPVFQRLFTYTFMMIGIIPTMLLMLYTGYLCHTEAAAGVVQTICFNAPFSLSDSGGFFAWIVASIITVIVILYVVTLIQKSAKVTG